jgi:Effector Associated Constant Component 1
MAVDARITIEDGGAAEYTALLTWLRGERALAGLTRLIRTPPRDGELGGSMDMLTVALGSGGVAVALANCLITWIRSRQRKVAVTIEGAGGRLTITGEGPADLLPLLCEILGEHDERS